jgi:hypothetical protein
VGDGVTRDNINMKYDLRHTEALAKKERAIIKAEKKFDNKLDGLAREKEDGVKALEEEKGMRTTFYSAYNRLRVSLGV